MESKVKLDWDSGSVGGVVCRSPITRIMKAIRLNSSRQVHNYTLNNNTIPLPHQYNPSHHKVIPYISFARRNNQ